MGKLPINSQLINSHWSQSTRLCPKDGKVIHQLFLDMENL